MAASYYYNFIQALLPEPPSTCGYCGPPGARSETESNFYTAAFVALQLTCEAYQKMIDRGWRRSGTYCYKPDLRRSCCPQYPIKLDVLKYKPSRRQRKALYRWNRFVLYGDESDKEKVVGPQKSKSGSKSQDASQYSLTSSVHGSERNFISDQQPIHNFEVTLEPASYTKEKYELFKIYQERIHKDESSPFSFERFLVKSPLKREPIPYTFSPPHHLPKEYGSYHQMYRLDGKLIAMSVLDILPSCVSSVYFMYDNDWERFSLGKLSAMREAALVKEIYDAGVTSVNALYLGFYVHACIKMRYKAEYSPSFLVDPEEYTWWPYEECSPLLDQFHYACFAHQKHSLSSPAAERTPLPAYNSQSLNDIPIIVHRLGVKPSITPLPETEYWAEARYRNAMLTLIDSLSLELSRTIVFEF